MIEVGRQMHTVKLDHVTIDTTDLDTTLKFYEHFLGLKAGPRPDFSVGGAWLYPAGGDYPILHIIEVNEEPQNKQGTMFNHFAFRQKGLDACLEKVKLSGVPYTVTPVPETELVQIQFYDPNQLLVEITFENEKLDPSEIILPSAIKPETITSYR